jgi:hypothetical protein
MVVAGIFICRIRYIGIKVVGQFAPLLVSIAFALLNCGFPIHDSESDPNIFFIN